MLKKPLLLSSILASSLFATNGVNMIATSTVNRSMGGTGVAHYTQAANAIGMNPALISKAQSMEASFDVTYFGASVANTIQDSNPLAQVPEPVYAKSLNHIDMSFIPAMAFVMPIDDEFSFGFAFAGVAGMGVDYVNSLPTQEMVNANNNRSPHRKMKTSLLHMKMIPTFAYKTENVSFGISPVLGMGSLSINYDEDSAKVNSKGVPIQSTRSGLFGTNMGGETLEFAFGAELGMSVDVADNFTIGLSYKSPLSYEYKKVANFEQFGPDAAAVMIDDYMKATGKGNLADLTDPNALHDILTNAGLPSYVADTLVAIMPTTAIKGMLDRAAATEENLDNLVLEQPWEFAIGADYKLNDNLDITGDYRYIAWGSADGYKDFGWNNQHVFAMGMEYKKKAFSLRGGYNYAASPLAETKNGAGGFGMGLNDVQGHTIFTQALAMLNMVGFPAIPTTHYTFGMGYKFMDSLDVDFALVYSPEVEHTQSVLLNPVPDLNLNGLALTSLPATYTTKMSITTLSMGINYQW